MGVVQEKWKSGLLNMKLVAEILTGTLFYIEVGEDATVGDLKKAIAKQENLPGDRLILLLDVPRCSLDKDEASLKDYGVEDSSHIYIFFRPPYNIATSTASPKDRSASGEPSHSMDSVSGLTNADEVVEDETPHDEDASDEANQPSASVDQEE